MWTFTWMKLEFSSVTLLNTSCHPKYFVTFHAILCSKYFHILDWSISFHVTYTCCNNYHFVFLDLKTSMVFLYSPCSRYHPTCIDMAVEDAKKIEHFFCQSCTTENGKETEKSHNGSKQSDMKVTDFSIVHVLTYFLICTSQEVNIYKYIVLWYNTW